MNASSTNKKAHEQHTPTFPIRSIKILPLPYQHHMKYYFTCSKCTLPFYIFVCFVSFFHKTKRPTCLIVFFWFILKKLNGKLSNYSYAAPNVFGGIFLFNLKCIQRRYFVCNYEVVQSWKYRTEKHEIKTVW